MNGPPQIVRNALFLIFRQGLVAVADLVAVRFVLKAVGVEGQGICAMAAEWVAVFAFFSGTLRAAFQRFLSAEIARGADGDLSAAFSTALALAMSGGLAVLLLGETLGLWGLAHVLSFPVGSRSAVYAVYQLALVGAAAGFLTLPYQALAVARERMGVLAGCGIVESAAFLGVALLLGRLPASARLPVCAGTGLLAAALSLTYLVCRTRGFAETRVRPAFVAGRAKAVLAYFGWSFMGSVANTVRLSGTQIVMNRRAGVAFNSSWNVAFRAGTFLYMLISSVQQAIEPQLVKRRERGDRAAYLSLVLRSELWLSLLVGSVALPAFVFAPELVDLWLGASQPPQIVEFLRVFIVYFLFVALSAPLQSAIMAGVDVGRYQTGVSLLCVAGFLAAAVALFAGAPAWMAAACVAAANVAGFVYRVAYFRVCVTLLPVFGGNH